MANTLGKQKLQKPTAKPLAIARPLRSPGVSPVANVSKIATKLVVPQQRPAPVHTLGKQKKVDTGGAQSQAAPPANTNTLGKRKQSSDGGGGEAPLPGGNLPYVPDESDQYASAPLPMTDEEQAYYEQSKNAEVPLTPNTLFMMNNATVAVPKGVWQRIKDWFHDIFAGEDNISAPVSSAHILNNVMHVASIVFNDDGAHYVVTKIPCPAARNKNGSVYIGNEENPDWLQNAINRAKVQIQSKTEKGAIDRHIADVVLRARAGDQNAMALITMVRANAQAGNARAIASFRAFRDYIDKHPSESSMGAELANVRNGRAKRIQTAVVFANGKPLDAEVLHRLATSFGNESECFIQGARDWKKDLSPDMARNADPYRLQVYEVGQVLGRARALQQMRLPGVPITAYDPRTGWELGE